MGCHRFANHGQQIIALPPPEASGDNEASDNEECPTPASDILRFDEAKFCWRTCGPNDDAGNRRLRLGFLRKGRQPGVAKQESLE